MGYWEYPPLAEKFRVPIVVTGFEPLDLLDGIRRAVLQLESGRHEVENAYSRVVTYDGNRAAQKLLSEVFEVTDRAWRGIGVIPKSGWRLNKDYRDYDAELRFHITGIHTQESPLCHAGEVLRGAIKPGLRQRMHTASSARRHHGFKRGRLRRILQLRPLPVRRRARQRRLRTLWSRPCLN